MNYNDLAKYLSGELSPEERKNFEVLLKNDSVLQKEFDDVNGIWNDAVLSQYFEKEYIVKSFNKVEQKISIENSTTKHVFLSYKIIAAASVALIVVASILLLLLNSTTINSTDQKVTVTLPDNSNVVLNKNTTLEYNRWFNIRNVTLNGEAFFNIEHNAKKPFVVYTNKSEITVLGTSFYVQDIFKLNKMQVKVTTGTVRVGGGINGLESDGLIVEKGEMAEVNYMTNKILKYSSYDINELAWNTGHLEFKNTSLLTVFELLKHTYDYNIKVNRSGIEDLVFTGIFDQTPINDAAETLSKTFDINYKHYPKEKLVVFY